MVRRGRPELGFPQPGPITLEPASGRAALPPTQHINRSRVAFIDEDQLKATEELKGEDQFLASGTSPLRRSKLARKGSLRTRTSPLATTGVSSWFRFSQAKSAGKAPVSAQWW